MIKIIWLYHIKQYLIIWYAHELFFHKLTLIFISAAEAALIAVQIS